MTIGKIHWTDYLGSMLIFGGGALVSLKIYSASNSDSWLFVLMLLSIPLLQRWVANQFKRIEVRDDGLYFKEGFLFEKSTEIKYSKINEIKLNQNIVQKNLKAGNLVVLTGNDTHTHFPSLDNILEFKSKIEEKMPKN